MTFRITAPSGRRVVKAVGYVNGKRVVTRKGSRLRSIVLRRPSAAGVRVRIVLTTDTGKRTTIRRTYRACSKRAKRAKRR